MTKKNNEFRVLEACLALGPNIIGILQVWLVTYHLLLRSAWWGCSILNLTHRNAFSHTYTP